MLKDPRCLLEELACNFDSLTGELHEAGPSREAHSEVVKSGERGEERRLRLDLLSCERVIPGE